MAYLPGLPSVETLRMMEDTKETQGQGKVEWCVWGTRHRQQIRAAATASLQTLQEETALSNTKCRSRSRRRARSQRRSQMIGEVYVLKVRRISDGKLCYYVGVTRDLTSRLQEHRTNASGIVWKWSRGVIEDIETPLTQGHGDAFCWEMRETLARMKKHGFDNVRGWEFSHGQPLTCEQKAIIRTNIIGLNNFCRRCGRSGHYQSACTATQCDTWLADLGYAISVSSSRRHAARMVHYITITKKTSVNDALIPRSSLSEAALVIETALTDKGRYSNPRNIVTHHQFLSEVDGRSSLVLKQLFYGLKEIAQKAVRNHSLERDDRGIRRDVIFEPWDPDLDMKSFFRNYEEPSSMLRQSLLSLFGIQLTLNKSPLPTISQAKASAAQ